MQTCFTCYETARRWPTWEEDPVKSLGREFYAGRGGSAFIGDEIAAIAELVASHEEEFQRLMGRAAWRREHRR
jgi:hypothetical protein